MVLYRAGTLTVVDSGVAQVLNLGFVPDIFRMRNDTILANGTGSGITDVYWDRYLGSLSTPYTLYTTLTTYGTPVITRLASGTLAAPEGVLPYQTPDSLLFCPDFAPYNDATRVPMGQSQSLVVTDISRAANASVTATHAFTAADIGVTVVTFHIVHPSSMIQINTLSGIVQSVTSDTSFTVNINSTNFTAFDTNFDEVCTVITGAPVSTVYSGSQILNTAEANLGVIGLLLGDTIMVTEGDVWFYEAILQSPVTGP